MSTNSPDPRPRRGKRQRKGRKKCTAEKRTALRLPPRRSRPPSPTGEDSFTAGRAAGSPAGGGDGRRAGRGVRRRPAPESSAAAPPPARFQPLTALVYAAAGTAPSADTAHRAPEVQPELRPQRRSSCRRRCCEPDQPVRVRLRVCALTLCDRAFQTRSESSFVQDFSRIFSKRKPLPFPRSSSCLMEGYSQRAHSLETGSKVAQLVSGLSFSKGADAVLRTGAVSPRPPTSRPMTRRLPCGGAAAACMAPGTSWHPPTWIIAQKVSKTYHQQAF